MCARAVCVDRTRLAEAWLSIASTSLESSSSRWLDRRHQLPPFPGRLDSVELTTAASGPPGDMHAWLLSRTGLRFPTLLIFAAAQ